MRPVGYLVKYPGGLSGERGLFYNYILASNGLFIEAETPLIAACIPAAECDVRGLAPMESKVVLTYGSVPQRFWDLILDTFLAAPDIEHYAAVTADAGYHIYIPVQEKDAGSVTYEVGDNVVLDIHSHGHGGARFSTTDNTDEAGLKLYGVVGTLNATPVVRFRIGVYGYFKTLAWGDVFDGSLAGATEFQIEEVNIEDDLHCIPQLTAGGLADTGRRLRWNWWLRR